jgi:hypothetical protein
LDDLLNILKRSRDEFNQLRERGRRSVFHKKEYVHALRDIVIQHENDSRLAANAEPAFTPMPSLATKGPLSSQQITETDSAAAAR